MSSWNKWLFGGLGWALGGPIGGILGFALGSISEEAVKIKVQGGTSRPLLQNDFSAALLVLCAAVMKAEEVQKEKALALQKQAEPDSSIVAQVDDSTKQEQQKQIS